MSIVPACPSAASAMILPLYGPSVRPVGPWPVTSKICSMPGTGPSTGMVSLVRRAQAHADVANLGLGQTRCDAQRFVEDLLDAGHSGVRVKASASFPSGADRDTTVRPGDHIVTAEGTEHGPGAGVSPRQAEMNDLPTLWCHRDVDAQLLPKGLGPGTTSNHDCPG